MWVNGWWDGLHTSNNYLAVRLRIEEITRKLATEQYDDGVVERSPSPEPMYDNNGKRTNTREQRQREKLTKERQKYVTEAMLISPYFRVYSLP
jgi:splicing factor 1